MYLTFDPTPISPVESWKRPKVVVVGRGHLPPTPPHCFHGANYGSKTALGAKGTIPADCHNGWASLSCSPGTPSKQVGDR